MDGGVRRWVEGEKGKEEDRGRSCGRQLYIFLQLVTLNKTFCQLVLYQHERCLDLACVAIYDQDSSTFDTSNLAFII